MDTEYYNDHSPRTPGQGAPSIAPISAEEAQRRHDQMLQSNLDSLRKSMFSVDKRDGSSRIFGFKVSERSRPLVEILLSSVLPYVSHFGSEAVYHQGFKIAQGFKYSKVQSHKIGKVAENALRWGLLAAQPIDGVIGAGRQYSQARRELYQELEPVVSSTKASYKNNEVIRVAFDELHDQMVTDMKMVAANLPTLATYALFSVQHQLEFSKKRDKHFELTHELDSALDRVLSEKISEKVVGQIEKKNAEQTLLEKKKKEFLRRTIKGPDGKTLSKPQLAQQFDEAVEEMRREQRYEQRRAVDAKFDVDHKGHNAERDNKFNFGMALAIPAAASVSQIIKNNIEEGGTDRGHKVNAWQMIKHLREEIGKDATESRGRSGSDGVRSADDVYVTAIGAREGERITLKEYILEIFQEHERDRTGTYVRERDVGASAKKQKLIDPMGPSLIAQLKPAIDTIAEYIADGRLDAYALVNLVGDNKVVCHKPNGARVFAKNTEMSAILDSLVSVMNTKENVKSEEFFSDFADPALIQGVLKRNLAEMKGKEKAYFAALFPDDILQRAGMNKNEIVATRKQAHEFMNEAVVATVRALAGKDAEYVKQLGLSENDMSAIGDLAKKVEEGDMQALLVATEGRNKEVIAAIRRAGLNAQANKIDQGFWTKRIAESESIRTEVQGKIHEAKERSSDRDGHRRFKKLEGGHAESALEREYAHKYNDDDDSPSL